MTISEANSDKPKILVNDLNLWYADFQALKGIFASFQEKKITAIIGPSGCGKSTLLRVFNRMNDLIEGVRTSGEAFIDGLNIIDAVASGRKNQGRLPVDLIALRKKVGMVFQRPNPFPLSVYENIVFGEKIHSGRANKSRLDEMVEMSLKEVLLWDDLKDKLRRSALNLSLEQKQRLCIARLIAVKSDTLLMDEPCSTLDPQSTARIEELMRELKHNYTIIIVTHNMQQAARVSDETGFMLLGELIEFGKTDALFTNPKDRRTEDYITGRYG